MEIWQRLCRNRADVIDPIYKHRHWFEREHLQMLQIIDKRKF